MKILFVENHAVFAGVVTTQFLSAHDVTVVSSVAAAREALRVSTFDVMLVDYDLDDAKGSVLVADLRRAQVALPIIGVSAKEIGNQELRTAGADAVVAKTEFARIGRALAGILSARRDGGKS